VGGERLAHDGALAVDKVEDAGRAAGLVEELREEQRRERRHLARLEHDRVARRQRRGHLEGHLVHRPVPWCDARAHAERLVQQDLFRAERRAIVEVELLEHGNERLQVAEASADLRAPCE